jgi:hypothetical protein
MGRDIPQGFRAFTRDKGMVQAEIAQPVVVETGKRPALVACRKGQPDAPQDIGRTALPVNTRNGKRRGMKRGEHGLFLSGS